MRLFHCEKTRKENTRFHKDHGASENGKLNSSPSRNEIFFPRTRILILRWKGARPTRSAFFDSVAQTKPRRFRRTLARIYSFSNYPASLCTIEERRDNKYTKRSLITRRAFLDSIPFARGKLSSRTISFALIFDLSRLCFNIWSWADNAITVSVLTTLLSIPQPLCGIIARIPD